MNWISPPQPVSDLGVGTCLIYFCCSKACFINCEDLHPCEFGCNFEMF